METIEKVKQNGYEVGSEGEVRTMTKPEQCMWEIEATLKKYNCEPICTPQMFFGQQVMAWAVKEIKG